MLKIEYIEFYVANIKKSLDFYVNILKFVPIATHSDNEKISFLLKQNNIKFILTSSVNSQSDINDQFLLHGDGVKDIAFSCDNIEKHYQHAIKNGSISLSKPALCGEGIHQICKATVKTFGDTTHTFLERFDNAEDLLPGYKRITHNGNNLAGANLVAIDHLAICVEPNTLDKWVEHYVNVYGFQLTHEEYVETANSGMNSKAVGNENVKFVFVEPLAGKHRSQVAEFLDKYKSSGVQHIAFSTNDIVTSVKVLRETGLCFLPIPESYYEMQKNKLQCKEDIFQSLKEHSILIDRNEFGYLYQIFTKPVTDRHTLFFEIIQRAGCEGFGSRNIRALFEAIEQEQMKRETSGYP